jgi:hypothetical protein
MYNCHRLSTRLQLKISYHIISYLQRGPRIIPYFLVSQLHFVKQRIHYMLYLASHILVYLLTLILLMWRKGWAPNSIPIYIQQDATLNKLFITGICSTCFGWYFHPSSGPHTPVSTASGIFHTVTAICCYRGRVGTGLSVLWVAFANHSTLKPVPTLPRQRQIAVTVWQIPDAVDTGVCAPDDGWKYHP